MKRDQPIGATALLSVFNAGEQIMHTSKGNTLYGVVIVKHAIVNGRACATYAGIKTDSGQIYTSISGFATGHKASLGETPSTNGWNNCKWAPAGVPRTRTDLWTSTYGLRYQRARLQR